MNGVRKKQRATRTLWSTVKLMVMGKAEKKFLQTNPAFYTLSNNLLVGYYSSI